MAEALAEALVEGEGATGEAGIHRHHIGIEQGQQGFQRSQQRTAMRCWRGRRCRSGMNKRISSRVASWIGNSAVEGVAMGRGGDEAVLPVVELVRGSPWALCCLPSPCAP